MNVLIEYSQLLINNEYDHLIEYEYSQEHSIEKLK